MSDLDRFVIVAASRDQASIMLRQVQGYIRRSAAPRKRLRVVQREVRDERTRGRIRVLAADSDTLDGQIPTLALIDDLARTKTEEAYGLPGTVWARAPVDWWRSPPRRRSELPAGGDCGPRRTRWRASFAREGADKHASSDGFAWHALSLSEGDDLNDLKLLKSANPSVISSKEWEACAEQGIEIPEGAEGVIVGVDIGYTRDCFAAVPVWPNPEGLIVLDEVRILVPTASSGRLWPRSDGEAVYQPAGGANARSGGCP